MELLKEPYYQLEIHKISNGYKIKVPREMMNVIGETERHESYVVLEIDRELPSHEGEHRCFLKLVHFLQEYYSVYYSKHETFNFTSEIEKIESY